jgi:hypothetical protein
MEEPRTMSSIFQTRHGEDAYPIGRFILARAKALGFSRTDLVRRLGYRELNSGHRALTELMLTGMLPPFIQKKLAAAVEVEPDLLDAVLAATAQELRDEAGMRMVAKEQAYRAAFRPHLQVATARRVPSPIFIAAMLTTARLRCVPLPDDTFATATLSRDRIIKALIIEHYRSRRGHVSAFGAITGYVLVLLVGYGRVDFGLPYDRHGDPAGPMQKIERLPEASLGTKRGDARLTGLFKNSPIQVVPMSRDW